MRPNLPSVTLSLLLIAALQPAPAAAGGGGHGGLPTLKATLHAAEVTVPFELPDDFPVPVVEVRINGSGPWRLGVDTAMGGTILLRQELTAKMDLPVIGKAMVGDSSGAPPRPADLVKIDSLRLGQLEVGEIIGVGFAAGEAHLNDVPDDLHGLLGNSIYAELLMTLDYPARTLTFREGELPASGPGVVPFKEQGKVMVVDLDVAGQRVPVIVDSGSRGTITLPASMAGTLPLQGDMREVASFSTVAATYRRQAATLDGRVALAATTLVEPELSFADEDTPRLIGYGVLKHYALTIDQANGRMRWVSKGNRIAGVTVEH